MKRFFTWFLIAAAISGNAPAAESSLRAIQFVRMSDGRLALAALTSDETAYWRVQTRPGGCWDGWVDLEGSKLQAAAIAVNKDNRLEAFAVGKDRSIYSRYQIGPGGAWSEWGSMQGTNLSQVAAATNADGRVEIFALSRDGSVYHRWQQQAGSGAWADWSRLEARDLRQIAVSSANVDGRLALVAIGRDGQAYLRQQVRSNADWGPWEGLQGRNLQRIAVANNADGRLEVFAIGADQAIYHKWQSAPGGSWSDWSPLAGHDLREITATRDANGRLELAALGADGVVYLRMQEGQGSGRWTDWQRLGDCNVPAYRRLDEAASSHAKRWAIGFDFADDACYPSPAISVGGIVNTGLEEQSSGITKDCRFVEQLENSNTYYRSASITRGGVTYAVHMYALYFMKDKTVETSWEAGHRHDWEFALIWTTNDVLTHASYSYHGKVETKSRDDLHFDAGAPDQVKIVYYKQLGTTHRMRFAEKDELARNDLKRWFAPTIVDWGLMRSIYFSNQRLRDKLNAYNFDQANCSVNDNNFFSEIAKHPPSDYPGGSDWKKLAP